MNIKRLSAASMALVLCAVLCAVLTLGGCGANTRQRLTDINPDDFGGIDVGVPMAWSPDYMLSGRTDLNLLRFDTQADALLALKYNRIDAYASERVNANYLVSLQPGFEILPTPIGEDSFVAFFSNESVEAYDEFNAFIKEFMQTDEYADIVARVNTFENGEYVNKPVPANEDGRILRLSISADVYPYTGIDFETGEYIGFEMEIAQWFAYKCGYTLEVTDSTYETGVLDLAGNRIDLYMCALSSYYRDEVELSQKALVSDPYLFVDMVLIVVGDEKALESGLDEDV